MLFLVDEDLGKRFSDLLNNRGFEAVFAGDVMRSFPDENILAFAKKEGMVILHRTECSCKLHECFAFGAILTGDRDFGELIFRLKMPSKGAVLFRTMTDDPEKKFELAKNKLSKSEGKFIVARENGVRIRKL